MIRHDRFTIRASESNPGREWVVMLPGAGATTAVWAGQLRAFSRQFNVALVELPGHGRSARQRAEGGRERYVLEELIDELHHGIIGAGIPPCHVVALSLGTILARGWAARHPEQIRSSVLAGTIAELPGQALLLMKVGWYLRHVLPYMALYRVYAWVIMPGPAHHATRQLFYADARLLGRPEFNRWFDLAPDFLSLLGRLRSTRPRCPVLHVMGGGDRLFLKAAARLAVDDGSEIVVIGGTGHVCTVESPAAFNEAALAFLSRVNQMPGRPECFP